jgi:hypothetical protein
MAPHLTVMRPVGDLMSECMDDFDLEVSPLESTSSRTETAPDDPDAAPPPDDLALASSTKATEATTAPARRVSLATRRTRARSDSCAPEAPSPCYCRSSPPSCSFP